MKARAYETKINFSELIGYAFNNKKEFVNIFYDKCGLFQLHWQQGQVAYFPKDSKIDSKVISEFSAKNITESIFNVGEITKCVWRPGLYLDHKKALEIHDDEQNRSIKSIRILTDKLNEILLTIEPSPDALKSYGHKIRELLVLACTEVEGYWREFFRIAVYTQQRTTTNDYIKLKDKLFLDEYKIGLNAHPFNISYMPFKGWSVSNPTDSLDWYDAYNKTKHDKNTNFSQATLEYCIKAIMGAIVLFCVRYSPYAIVEGNGVSAKVIDELFSIELEPISFGSFYIPLIESVQMATGAFVAPLASRFEKEWMINPLVI